MESMVTLQTILDNSPDIPVPIEWGVEVFLPAVSDDLDSETSLYPALLPSSLHSDTLAFAGKTLRYVRVGNGKTLNPDSLGVVRCGSVVGAARCTCHEEGHDLVLLKDNCGRLQCPVCYHQSVSRSAHRMADRLEGMFEAWKVNGVNLGKLKHITFSPPQKDWPKTRVVQDGGKALRKLAYRHFNKYFKDRAYGGFLIFHGERKKHKDGTECEDRNCNKVHQWVWSPHFHYLGYGYFSPESPLYHSETGWIYKNIGSANQRDAFLTANYQLSHAGTFLDLKTSKQVGSAYWAVGMLANCKGGRKVLNRSTESVPCSLCAKALHDYGVRFDVPDWSDDRGEHLRYVLVVEYYINRKAKTYLQQELEGFEEVDGLEKHPSKTGITL